MKLDDKISVLQHLEEYGYAIQENVISKEDCDVMTSALDDIMGKKKDEKTLQSTDEKTILFNVHLEKPDIFLNKIDIPQVMDVVSKVLKEEFILSNFNGTLSGPKGGNGIHIDSRIPINDFASTFQIVALLCLDDFTPTNGSTKIWPGSHKSGVDPRYLRNTDKIPEASQEFVPKGSVIYTLGQTWHDVGPNLDGTRRWGIIAYYSRWWIKPTFNFLHCGQEIFAKLNARQKILFGFTSNPPSDTKKRINTVISPSELSNNYDEVLKAIK